MVSLFKSIVLVPVVVIPAVVAVEVALRALFHGTGFLDYQRSAVELAVVQRAFGSGGFGVIFKLYETESAAAASHFVGNHGSGSYSAVLAE